MCAVPSQDAVSPELLGLTVDGHVDAEGVDRDLAPLAKRKRMSSSERQAVKFFRELETLLGCLTPELLRTLRPTKIALFLGTTPLRPKEIFSFSLDRIPTSYEPHHPEPAMEKVVDNAGRRLIRECIPIVASCAPASAPLKAFLMIKAKGGEGEECQGVIPSAECLKCFLPKRDFVPLVRQTKVDIEFILLVKGAGVERNGGSGENGECSGHCEISGDRGECEKEGELGELPVHGVEADHRLPPEESLWYQCTASVKGLRGAGL